MNWIININPFTHTYFRIMKIVALIPIKMGSKRIPKKNIRPFYDGTPLVHFIQKACLGSKLIDEIYVYCSDEVIQDYILPGVKYLKRPEYLDGDDMNANDFIRAFMSEVKADIYVNVHATSPFATSASIDTCIEKVMSGEYDSAFCAECVRAFMWEDGRPINFDPDHFPRTQDLPLIYAETSIAYVFPEKTFKRYDRRVGIKPYIHEVGKIEAVDIDYPEDFTIADAIYKEIINKL